MGMLKGGKQPNTKSIGPKLGGKLAFPTPKKKKRFCGTSKQVDSCDERFSPGGFTKVVVLNALFVGWGPELEPFFMRGFSPFLRPPKRPGVCFTGRKW